MSVPGCLHEAQHVAHDRALTNACGMMSVSCMGVGCTSQVVGLHAWGLYVCITDCECVKAVSQQNLSVHAWQYTCSGVDAHGSTS